MPYNVVNDSLKSDCILNCCLWFRLLSPATLPHILKMTILMDSYLIHLEQIWYHEATPEPIWVFKSQDQIDQTLHCILSLIFFITSWSVVSCSFMPMVHIVCLCLANSADLFIQEFQGLMLKMMKPFTHTGNWILFCCSHTVNLLTNMPKESYEELLTPLSDREVVDSKDIEYDGKNMEAILVLLDFLNARLDVVNTRSLPFSIICSLLFLPFLVAPHSPSRVLKRVCVPSCIACVKCVVPIELYASSVG